MNQAYLHTDNMEDVRERLENTVAQSSVETMYDGEDCFITVTQRNETTGNESKWSFCVDFGTNKVQMLEPTEDEEGFTSDNEVFRIIKNFLNGGSSREKRMNQPDYDAGEPIKITGFGNKIGSSKKSIKSGYVIKVTETDDDYTYSPTYVNGDSWQSKEPQIFETEEDAQEQAEDFRKYLNKRHRSMGGRWQYKLEVVKSSRKPIKSSTVYSDSFDEMVQKDFTYKGNKYTWNDSDCVYYNDNGDEDDFFMEIPEGAITSSKAIKSAVDPQIDELERVAHYALPYDNEITILNRDDKLVIKVALKDDIKRIRGEQAANVIFAKLQGNNKFMRMLDNLVHNDKEVECIVYDPDTNERFASINF